MRTCLTGGNAVNVDQLPLFAHNLPPLKLRDVVRTPQGTIGEVCQVWEGRDHYVVFAKSLPMDVRLPVFRRDELELLSEAERAEVWR